MIPPPQYVLIVDIIIYWVDRVESFVFLDFLEFFDFLEGANDASSAARLKFWQDEGGMSLCIAEVAAALDLTFAADEIIEVI